MIEYLKSAAEVPRLLLDLGKFVVDKAGEAVDNHLAKITDLGGGDE